ncbi:acyl-CoA dehydrogenase family protein [Novosphingobium sp. KCTC 2891]|uniref:acyl-CoA dehydrogenase family protein n=1 Tax=Novosphingobium sp. KCTC 2891 TaxID=2989730 RepID=UPI002222140F|nr:acyl-CoA dehydrogenase family protein [Novosphingobium sp. KCTC 2891]MCW1381210.1 acyl-CoA dehydrogenase family protein [Novosphingobium sp. KCTC 2891]
MSENRALLVEMAEGLFADLAGASFEAAWPRVAEAGFASLLVSADQGGFGGDWGDVLAVLRLAGLNAVAAPVAEPIIAHALLAQAGIAAPAGLVTLVGRSGRTPFGRHADAVVSVADGVLSLHARGAFTVEEGTSLAGEPSDLVKLTGAPAASAPCAADLDGLGAFARVAQASGALESAFTLAIDHVNTRVQFGRTLAKFQAVQQALAEFSEEAAAVDAAAAACAAALDVGDAGFEIAAAKMRLGLAVDRATPIAHRMHGAIGFTMEYALNRYTRRLMAWRSEFGNDAFWAEALGRRVAVLGGHGLWREVAARTDRLIGQEA